MARKRKNSEGGISLDSLMDALTNVVAVLILVLILVQADVSKKVQKFFDDLQPATPEQIAETKNIITELQRKQRLAEERLVEKPATPQQLEAEMREFTLLEKSLKENKELLADLDQVKSLEKKVRAERDTENTQTIAIQKEIAQMEGLLGTVPPLSADKPTVVNIPNSRPIPEDAQTYYAIVNRDRIHIIDYHTPLAMFKREFERKKADFLIQRTTVKGKPDKFLYDGTKIIAHFKDFNWGNSRGQKIEIQPVPTNYFLYLSIRPNMGSGGTPLDEIAKPDSEFIRSLHVIRQTYKSILLYQVATDSFRTYLAAREISERGNISAGWEINGTREFRIPIPDVTVKRLVEPPPPDPNAPKRPPSPPRLKPRLD